MTGTPSATILNVNDDAATRYLYTQVLRRAGFEVREATTGDEALRSLRERRPDLVLLDVKLPDVSGLDVCRQIKATPSTATVLVVQTSATFASSDRRVQGLDSGADAYLASPLEAGELVATVRALLRMRRAEDEERRTARKLAKTFDAITDPVLIVDDSGIVRQCNEAALRMLQEDGVLPVGRSGEEALRRFLTAKDLRAMLAGARQGGRREREVSLETRWFRLSADPIRTEAGATEGCVLLLTDVTARKALEEEHRARAEELALEAQRKDEFLAMLAHELRNPLNAIAAANALLDRRGSPDAGAARLRSVISRQTGHLARMIDDLLEVSRITRGKIRLCKRPVDLVAIVREAAQGSQSIVEARSQHLVLTLPPHATIVDGDDLRLEQVVLNLVANAAKYSEPGTTIRVSLALDGARCARLSVADEGVGIPEDMLTQVFEPFVQVDQTLARSLGGLGIGLTMVKSLVELHGGRVEAKSGGIGTGTELVVVLPLAPEDASVAPRAEKAAPSSGPLNVLVVEDDADTRELLQTWLELSGHSVRSALDGREGLELLLATKPDIAFVDIGLPELDGFEVAEHVRATTDGRAVHLVAVTGYGRPEDRARARDAGFDDYIVKPLDHASLERVLASFSASRA